MVMKSLWGKAAEFTEMAKNYAGDYLKQDNTLLKDIEAFKKETLTLLDEKMKENQAMQEMIKKNKGIMNDQETQIQTLSAQLKQLILEKEAEQKEKELLQKEKEELNKRINSTQINNLKTEITTTSNRLKLDIADFDKEINTEIKRQFDAIKALNEKMKDNDIMIKKEEEGIIKGEGEVNQGKESSDKVEDNKEEEPKRQEEIAQSLSYEEKNDKKKRRKKKKKNQQTKAEPKANEEEQQQQLQQEAKTTEETQPQTTQETIPQIEDPIPNVIIPQPINNIITIQSIDIDLLSAKLFSLLSPVIESHKTSLDSQLSETINSINDQLAQISQASQLITTENITLTAKLTQMNQANSSLESQLNSIQFEHSKLNEDYQTSLSKANKLLKEKTQAESDLNVTIEKINSISLTINELQNTITAHQAELSKEKNNTQTIIQIFKQFFLMFLIDDIFIDSIESIFKEAASNSQVFIEKVYQLAKYIKPKIDYDYHKEFFVSNKELLAKINRFNLETNLIDIEKQYNRPFKSLEQLLSYDYSQSDFIISLIKELVLYIDNLSKTILTQSNKQTELAQSLKQSEDNKKAENNRLISLQSEIKDKNSLIASFDKTTKESRQLRGDIESLNSKIVGLITDKNNLTQEKQVLAEKLASVNQQSEIFKVENSELIHKVTESQREVNTFKAKVASLSKDVTIINDIKSQLDKKDKTIKDYHAQCQAKETEYKNLQNSYMELESFFETARKEKEASIDNYKNQINDLNKQIETLSLDLQTAKANENTTKTANNDVMIKENEALEAKIAGLEIENRSIKEQKEKIKAYSEEILKRVQNDFKDSEFLIDKRMINSILFKYFNPYTNHNIKHSLLETLANFMNYTNDERKQLGLAVKTGGNEPNLIQNNNNHKDKLKELGEELYDFITNS